LRENTTCYAGIHASTETPIDEDNDGVFLLNVRVSDHDITDGLGYTLFVGEKLSRWEEDFGWISGTRSSLRNVGLPLNAERKRIRGPQDPAQVISPIYVGGLASDHPGGVYLLMGSGEYQFRSASMDHQILQQIASRADGGIPVEWKSQQPLIDTKNKAETSASSAAKTDQAAEVDTDSGLQVDAEGSNEPPLQ
jgi:hypothetical protein